jgi:hypothetical protein
MKLKLIERLLKSVNKDMSSIDVRFERSFGAWDDSRDADEIINEIENSRNFDREIESF